MIANITPAESPYVHAASHRSRNPTPEPAPPRPIIRILARLQREIHTLQISMPYSPDGRSKTHRIVPVTRCDSKGTLANLHNLSRPSKCFYFDLATWYDSPDANVPISLTISSAASSKKK
jgi:hypothetical protein